MHDIPPNKLIADEYPVQSRPELPVQTVDGFASLSIMQSEAPYRPPASMDMDKLEALLAAKVSAAEDHFLGIREDPGYFADAVLVFKEHRLELVKDTNGCPHPIFTMEGPRSYGRESWATL
jgi:hypothetical protein